MWRWRYTAAGASHPYHKKLIYISSLELHLHCLPQVTALTVIAFGGYDGTPVTALMAAGSSA